MKFQIVFNLLINVGTQPIVCTLISYGYKMDNRGKVVKITFWRPAEIQKEKSSNLKIRREIL